MVDLLAIVGVTELMVCVVGVVVSRWLLVVDENVRHSKSDCFSSRLGLTLEALESFNELRGRRK